MAAPLIVRLVMDAAGYLKTVDTAVGANTKLELSATKSVQASLSVGEAMQVSATKSVQASLRATEALKGQVAGYRELAAASTESAAVRERAALLANRAEGRLNSSLGLGTAGLAATSKGAQTAERDLGKTTRGLLAGSGAAAGLGRSLAFASTGFIAVASGATVIKSSIEASIALAKTQRQVDAQLKTTGKTWDQYGGQIDAADLKLSHISGFTNQELLQSFGYLVRVTGNVSEALKLNATAADVARGRNISLNSASIALGKALGGSETALKRLGITIPKTLDRMQALAYVQEKFAGQAQAGATVGDRFHASLVNTEEIIGNALLPTFTRLTTEIGDWLSKMNESGRLQRDVNEAVTLGGYAFHALGAVIGTVDKVTGSFANTLKILFQFFLGREIVKALIGVDKLAASWLGVADAANTAATAEGRATATGAGSGVAGAAGAEAGAGGGLIGGLAARRAAQQAVKSEAAVSRIGRYTGTLVPAEEGVAAVGTAAIVSTGKVAALRGALSGLGALAIAPIAIPIVLNIENQIKGPISRGLDSLFGHGQTSAILRDLIVPHSVKDFLGVNAFNDIFRYHGPPPPPPPYYLTHLSQSGGVPPFLQLPGTLGQAVRNPTGSATPTSPFGGATPIAVYSKYTQTITEQLAVAQAALTKTTKDDVVAAKQIIARIKRGIDRGHYEGASLVQALQDEATQQGVLDNARQAAAQQAATIAAAKQAAASSYTTPIDLQLAEARAQLTKSTADDIRVEKEILAAAKAAVASGKKNKQGQLAALQIELQAQQAIQSFAGQTNTTFTEPLKLQLALAKAQATGGNQTGILLKMKAALEKALKSAKGNIQKQIDIYNQIAAINQQLGADANLAFGNYKQASLAAETAGLGLTDAQRKALEARLSQRGPGGTVPSNGVGAAGFIIGPDGRPVQVHHHRRPRHGRTGADSQTVSPARFDKLVRVLERTANRPLRVIVDLDGKVIADNTTRHQELHRRHNSSQRRGPNAGG